MLMKSSGKRFYIDCALQNRIIKESNDFESFDFQYYTFSDRRSIDDTFNIFLFNYEYDYAVLLNSPESKITFTYQMCNSKLYKDIFYILYGLIETIKYLKSNIYCDGNKLISQLITLTDIMNRMFDSKKTYSYDITDYIKSRNK